MSPARLSRLAPIALLAVLAASCGDNEKSAGTTGATPPAAPTTAAIGQPPAKGKGNTLLVGTQDIYPLLGGDLSDLAPNQVLGNSTRVVALVGTDGFWAGRSKSRRILVKVRLKGTKAPKLRVGQKADFIGALLPVTRAQQQGLDAAGRALLAKQGVYVLASIGDLDLR